ncbi:hypothetical protein GA0115238_11281, partial [Streptomyces sp. di50b]
AITGATDGTVILWNLLSKKVVSRLLLPASCEAVAVSPTGTLVCAFGNDIAVLRRDHNGSSAV